MSLSPPVLPSIQEEHGNDPNSIQSRHGKAKASKQSVISRTGFRKHAERKGWGWDGKMMNERLQKLTLCSFHLMVVVRWCSPTLVGAQKETEGEATTHCASLMRKESDK
ncbi:hypothetical protein CEXT_146281 [Caerostris extrusa]|uniref:Uncharacterized protein n=1 Tax=Caerostris extrusa TaxID=172846 RepID=A0AAV4SQR9_CAEEX|nr:hypothetical protein CEXT_146281 [Caerostris extrusa]